MNRKLIAFAGVATLAAVLSSCSLTSTPEFDSTDKTAPITSQSPEASAPVTTPAATALPDNDMTANDPTSAMYTASVADAFKKLAASGPIQPDSIQPALKIALPTAGDSGVSIGGGKATVSTHLESEVGAFNCVIVIDMPTGTPDSAGLCTPEKK